MAYYIAEITTDRHLEEYFTNLLLTLGAAGLSAEGPQFVNNSIEAGLAEIWAEEDREGDELIIKGYFLANGDWPRRRRALEEAVDQARGEWPQYPIQALYYALEDDSWAESWKQYYKPFPVGRHLVIKPLWEPYEAREGDVILNLDPGMAFGSGDHPTTGGALLLIEELMEPGFRLLDLGCGTGILGLAGALLGAAEVTAVDKDPEALKATAKNFAVNGLSDRLTLIDGDLTQESFAAQGQFDVIAANIVAGVIIEILPLVSAALKPGGRFIAGGVIRAKGEAVQKALAQAGLTLVEIREEGEWLTFLAKK